MTKKQPTTPVMTSAMIQAIAGGILEQVDGGGNPEIVGAVMASLAKEAARQIQQGKKVTIQSFTLAKVAKILKEEKDAKRIYRRLVDEVNGWRNFFPVASVGRGEKRTEISWRKSALAAEMPQKKGSKKAANDEIMTALTSANSLIAELTAKVDAMFTELGDACKRIAQLEAGLTVHGTDIEKLVREFDKVLDVSTSPEKPINQVGQNLLLRKAVDMLRLHKHDPNTGEACTVTPIRQQL